MVRLRAPVHQQDSQATERCQYDRANEEPFAHLVIILFSEFQQPCFPGRTATRLESLWAKSIHFGPASLWSGSHFAIFGATLSASAAAAFCSAVLAAVCSVMS